MTNLNLELSTKQINLLFQSLESLRDNDSENHRDIMELIRYIDREVFGE